MARRKGLGKNIDALIRRATLDEPVPLVSDSQYEVNQGKRSADLHETLHSEDASEAERLNFLPATCLQPGRYQPRRDMDPDALQALADSIKQQGLMQPIVVRHLEVDRYEIVAGERRWRAAQLAGLDQVPCIVRVLDDRSTIALSIIENIQREDLTPIEEAMALQQLQQAFDLTHQQVAEAVGKSRTGVTNLLRLLSLGDQVKQMLDRGELEMGHARALLGLSDAKQSVVARHVVQQGLSVRQTEAYIRTLNAASSGKVASTWVSDPNIERLETKLSSCLGTRVNIKHTRRGSGKLVVNYTSLEELDGILNHIQ